MKLKFKNKFPQKVASKSACLKIGQYQTNLKLPALTVALIRNFVT